jgi:hypothetical protein
MVYGPLVVFVFFPQCARDKRDNGFGFIFISLLLSTPGPFSASRERNEAKQGSDGREPSMRASEPIGSRTEMPAVRGSESIHDRTMDLSESIYLRVSSIERSANWQ